METVFVLLMMTVGLSHAIETHCDARQNGAQCYAALGGTIDLRLVEKIETRLEYQFKKNNTLTILKIKDNGHSILDEAKDRSSFDVSSGTFKMSDITRSDEAHYVLGITNASSGQPIERKHLHLSVQAPVSPPKLSSECLSQGQMRVSCSCEGDSVHYSWTLDGRTPTDKQLLSGHHDTNTITLTPGTSGLLRCDVSNIVSRDAAYEDIAPCAGFRFISCTLANGTQIPGWMFDKVTLSMTPTTTSMTPSTTSMTPSTTSGPASESSSLDHSVYVYFKVAEMCVLLVACLGFYIYYKMKTRPPPKQDPLYCNMVVMETQ